MENDNIYFIGLVICTTYLGYSDWKFTYLLIMMT